MNFCDYVLLVVVVTNLAQNVNRLSLYTAYTSKSWGSLKALTLLKLYI